MPAGLTPAATRSKVLALHFGESPELSIYFPSV